MPFVTKLDYSDNRQIKQYQLSNTQLSGTTQFGIPYSGLTGGVIEESIKPTGVLTNITSTFSGNSTTTEFTFGDERMMSSTLNLGVVTAQNSGDTQNITGFTGADATIIDGNTVYGYYTGVTFDLTVTSMEEVPGGIWTGETISNNVTLLSGDSADFSGRTIWVDVKGITKTERLIINEELEAGDVNSDILSRDSEGNVVSFPINLLNDVVTGMTFNTNSGDLQLNTLRGSTVTENLNGRYLENGDNISNLINDIGYITGFTDSNIFLSAATFNTSNGILEFSNTSGGTFNVDIDGRYSLTGHTHIIDEIIDFPTNLAYIDQTNTFTQPQVFENDVTIGGNLLVSGQTIQVNSEISTADSVIRLNDGELGAGVTLGYSGFEIDRGSENAFWFGFDEVRERFTVGRISGLTTSEMSKTQVLATRSDTLTDQSIVKWDSTLNQLIDSGALISDFALNNIDNNFNVSQTINGNVTANNFIGNGSQLTGLTISQLTNFPTNVSHFNNDVGYITGFTDDYVTSISFNNGTLEFNMVSGGTFNIDIDNRYSLTGHTHIISDIIDFPTDISHFNNDVGYITGFTDDYVTSASFNEITGVIEFTRLSGGTFNVGINNRFSLTGHTHVIDDIIDFPTNLAYVNQLNTFTENQTLTNNKILYVRDGNDYTSISSGRIFLDTSGNAVNHYPTLALRSDATSWGVGLHPGGSFQIVDISTNNSVFRLQEGSLISSIYINSNGVYVNSAFNNLDFRVSSLNNANSLFVDGNTSNVGIGINNPTEKLEVDGNVKAINFIGNGAQLTGLTISQLIDFPSEISHFNNDVGYITGFTNHYLNGIIHNSNDVTFDMVGLSDHTLNGATTTTAGLITTNTQSFSGNKTFNGDVTATNFIGDGSQLTGLTISQLTNLPTEISYFNNDVGYITGFTNTFVTDFTYNNSNTLTIGRNQGESDLSVNIGVMSGLTVNGVVLANDINATTVSATTYLNLPLTSSDIENWNYSFDKSVSGITFDINTGILSLLSLTDVLNVNLDNRYSLFGHIHSISELNDFPTNISYFNNDSGYITGFTDDYVISTSFDELTGVIEFTRVSGGTFNIDIDGRYSLLGHSHIVSDITDFPTEISYFNNDTGYITGFTDTNIFVTGGTFSNQTGDITFTNISGGTFNVGIDGRYLLSSDYNPTDDYVTGSTFNNVDGNLTFNRLSGGTFNVDIDGRYSLLGHSHLVSDITDFPTEISYFNNDTGYITGFTNTFVTDFTYNNSNILTIGRNQGESDLSVNIGVMSGLTVNGDISSDNINLNGYIDFNTNANQPINKSGRVFYDNDSNSLAYFPDINQEVKVELGQQLYIKGFNNTNSVIPKGAVLSIKSATNGLPNFIPRIDTLSAHTHVVALAASDIQPNTEGLGLVNGILSGLNITNFNIGDVLYASPFIDGGYINSTKTFPFSARTDEIGYVLATGTTTGQIYVGINNEDDNLTLTDIERNILEGNVISTGTYEFSGITKTSNTTFDVAPMRGWVVKNTYEYATKPDVTNLYFSGATNVTTPHLSSSTATFVLVNSNSELVLLSTQPTPEERRANIYLGKIVHPDKTIIQNVNNITDYDVSPVSIIRDLFSPIKLINDGIILSPNGVNLSFNLSGGNLWGYGINWYNNQLNPNMVEIGAKTPATFQYRTLSGGTFLDTTFIDPTNYDVNGVVTPIPGNLGSQTSRASNQRVYLFPTGIIRVQYGQTWYETLVEAVAGLTSEIFDEYVNHKDNGILIATISISKACISLNDRNTCLIEFTSKFGELLGGTGGLSTTNLQQAYDNSVNPEIVTNNILNGVQIKGGTGNNTDPNLLIQNNNGVTTGNWLADGTLSATTISAGTYLNLPNNIAYVDQPNTFTQPQVFENNVTIGGNLLLSGQTIQIDSQISTADAVIRLNDGELGAGVTLGYSGFEIDRGSENDFWFGYDEVRARFTVGRISGLTTSEIANTQVLATRADIISDQAVVKWDSSSNQLVDTGEVFGNFALKDINNNFSVSQTINTSGAYDGLFIDRNSTIENVGITLRNNDNFAVMGVDLNTGDFGFLRNSGVAINDSPIRLNSINGNINSIGVGNFGGNVNVGVGNLNKKIILFNGERWNSIGTSSSDGNAQLTIRGGNFTHAVNFQDSYGTQTNYAQLVGGHASSSFLRLYKNSIDGNQLEYSVYGSNGANIGGTLEVLSASTFGSTGSFSGTVSGFDATENTHFVTLGQLNTALAPIGDIDNIAYTNSANTFTLNQEIVGNLRLTKSNGSREIEFYSSVTSALGPQILSKISSDNEINHGSGNISFYTALNNNLIERLIIDRNGKSTFKGDVEVIGQVKVKGNDGIVIHDSNDSLGGWIKTSTDRVLRFTQGDGEEFMNIGVGGGYNMLRLQPLGGNINIGTAGGGEEKLTIYQGNIALSGLYSDASKIGNFYDNSNKYGSYINFKGYGNFKSEIGFFTNATTTDIDPTEKMVLTDVGRLGVGTTNPTELLEVNGNGLFSSSSNTTVRINGAASGNASRMVFSRGGVNEYNLGLYGNNSAFKLSDGSNNSLLSITPDREYQIVVDGDSRYLNILDSDKVSLTNNNVIQIGVGTSFNKEGFIFTGRALGTTQFIVNRGIENSTGDLFKVSEYGVDRLVIDNLGGTHLKAVSNQLSVSTASALNTGFFVNSTRTVDNFARNVTVLVDDSNPRVIINDNGGTIGIYRGVGGSYSWLGTNDNINNNSDLGFKTSNSLRVLIDGDTGYVGLNTSTPNHMLDVRGSGYFLGDDSIANAPTELGFYLGKSLTDENRRLEIVSPSNGVSYIDFTKPSTDYRGRIAYHDSDDSFRLSTAASERFRILSNGNVAIGKQTAERTLDVNGQVRLYRPNNFTQYIDIETGEANEGRMRFTSPSNNVKGALIVNDSNSTTNPNGFLKLGTLGGTMTIDYLGNVLIGAGTIASEKVEIIGNVKAETGIFNEVKINNVLHSYSENLDVLSATTEIVATASILEYDAVFFEYVVKNEGNIRCGIIMATHDGVNTSFNDNSTIDLGNTSDVIFSVDILNDELRLLVDTLSDNWVIKTSIRGI